MDFDDVLRRRRMVRAFRPDAVPEATLRRVLEAGLRSPSAGFTQGLELLVLTEAADRAAFWEAETDAEWRRAHPRHQHTRQAPVVVLPLGGPGPYTRRYLEADKAGSGLGTEEAWPVPFWWFDAGCAVMAMLLAAVDAGLGALFMGVFRAGPALARRFGVPDELRPAGALLLGYPQADYRAGGSVARGARPFESRVHRGAYGVAPTMAGSASEMEARTTTSAS